MGTLGSYLREEREARGLDLRDAAQQTRISVNYLKAIENDDFSRLPGEVFVRGFLKNYAKFLQLPEQEVLRRYQELKAPAGKAAAAPPGPEGVAPVAPVHPGSRLLEQTAGTVSGRRSLEPYLWTAVGLIACIAVVLTLLPGKRSGKQHPAPGTTAPTGTAALATGTISTFAADRLYLEIEALTDTWVLVRTDASPQKKAVLKKGETVMWSAYERFLLSYGGIGSAVLRLNGRELEVPGPKDMVVRDLAVTAAGIGARKSEVVQPPRPLRPPQSPPPAPARQLLQEQVRPPAAAPAPAETAAQPAPAPPAGPEPVLVPAGEPAPAPQPSRPQE